MECLTHGKIATRICEECISKRTKVEEGLLCEICDIGHPHNSKNIEKHY